MTRSGAPLSPRQPAFTGYPVSQVGVFTPGAQVPRSTDANPRPPSLITTANRQTRNAAMPSTQGSFQVRSLKKIQHSSSIKNFFHV